jgi:NADP-dependent 3-hydroxy acid dehydrogenase YdfG
MSTKLLSTRKALITGASSGFGEATALTLGRAGAEVAITARREDRLRALAKRIEGEGGKAHVIVADFLKEADVLRAVSEAEAAMGGLDLLVNNAGVMFLEPVSEADLGRWRDMIELNLTALITASQAASRIMAGQGHGDIVNIASTAGHVANPNGAAYSATKFAVRAFSEALRKELVAKKVRVTIVSPGVAETELRDHVGNAAAKDAVNTWAQSLRQLQAEDIANAILYATSQPPHVSINEILMRPTDQER